MNIWINIVEQFNLKRTYNGYGRKYELKRKYESPGEQIKSSKINTESNGRKSNEQGKKWA